MAVNKNTIFALSTVAGRSAVAVIRLSGPEVLATLSVLTGLSVSEFKPRQMFYRLLRDQLGGMIDRTLVVYFPGSESFTGEDCGEIHCHGSLAVIKAILEDLSTRKGLRPAEPGEFSRHAFDNNKMDLAQIEGLGDLINAQTRRQLDFSLKQIGGAAAEKVSKWREELIKSAAFVEAYIDFPDEDLPDDLWKQSQDQLKILRSEFETQRDNGRKAVKLESGLNVVLAGPPNAGKSSLLNLLAREDRAIVSDIAGTTRDSISVSLELSGLPVTLTDTAGLRASGDEIENLGVQRSLDEISKADLVLFLFDLSDMVTSQSAYDDYGFFREDQVWKVFNKSDLSTDTINLEFLVSVKQGLGTDHLLSRLEEWVTQNFAIDGTDQIVAKERHIQIMNDSMEVIDQAMRTETPELFAENLRQLSQLLGRLIGQVDVEDLLDRIFGDFCIGK